MSCITSNYFPGAWRLEIKSNHLNSIPSMAFSGLERSLWYLVLSDNKFTRIPSDSIARLEKLNHLDLSGIYTVVENQKMVKIYKIV